MASRPFHLPDDDSKINTIWKDTVPLAGCAGSGAIPACLASNSRLVTLLSATPGRQPCAKGRQSLQQLRPSSFASGS